jgi:hypothetical protein
MVTPIILHTVVEIIISTENSDLRVHPYCEPLAAGAFMITRQIVQYLVKIV